VNSISLAVNETTMSEYLDTCAIVTEFDSFLSLAIKQMNKCVMMVLGKYHTRNINMCETKCEEWIEVIREDIRNSLLRLGDDLNECRKGVLTEDNLPEIAVLYKYGLWGCRLTFCQGIEIVIPPITKWRAAGLCLDAETIDSYAITKATHRIYRCTAVREPFKGKIIKNLSDNDVAIFTHMKTLEGIHYATRDEAGMSLGAMLALNISQGVLDILKKDKSRPSPTRYPIFT